MPVFAEVLAPLEVVSLVDVVPPEGMVHKWSTNGTTSTGTTPCSGWWWTGFESVRQIHPSLCVAQFH